MKNEIYKSIKANGFNSKDQDTVNNKRLGILKTFSDDIGRYIEVHPEKWGYSVIIYGNGFMNSYYPTVKSITDKKESKELNDFLRKRIKC